MTPTFSATQENFINVNLPGPVGVQGLPTWIVNTGNGPTGVVALDIIDNTLAVFELPVGFDTVTGTVEVFPNDPAVFLVSTGGYLLPGVYPYS